MIEIKHSYVFLLDSKEISVGCNMNNIALMFWQEKLNKKILISKLWLTSDKQRYQPKISKVTNEDTYAELDYQ